jgi:hypothetical protein
MADASPAEARDSRPSGNPGLLLARPESILKALMITSQKRTEAPLAARVEKIVMSTPVDDIHTHLYEPAFRSLLLRGIDDLLVYHYLVAEAFRAMPLPYKKFWALSKPEQAELIWNHLFIQSSPISEACRGVLTTLQTFGLDAQKKDLNALRKWFARWSAEEHVDKCMELANVRSICMTNSPFDDLERPLWEQGFARDARFRPALRIDPVVLNWAETARTLASWGYKVSWKISPRTVSGIRQFLADWTERIQPRYMMVSLPPTFSYPGSSTCAQVLEEAVLPHCREYHLPLALMPGVRREVNPELRLAGDGVGLSDLEALSNLCAKFPENRFLATVLARENQHELCVLARKFRNLHIFGCWWFVNTPSLIEEITRMRLELLGFSFTAQHSDARVLDQLIYKWQHSRRVVARVLSEKYQDLAQAGWKVSDADIQRDVNELFGAGFERFCAGARAA